MVQVLHELREEFSSSGTSTSNNNVRGNMGTVEAFCGVKRPVSIRIQAPAQAKNKGSGKRIKSKRELAIVASQLGRRKCHRCDQRNGHDARNCPLKDAAAV
nr:protein FAR1-RELATED SEQUENCE 5-like [Ipomoea batatas]